MERVQNGNFRGYGMKRRELRDICNKMAGGHHQNPAKGVIMLIFS